MNDLQPKIRSNCLCKYRKARGLSQLDVAQILELKSSSMISRWEKGSILPDLINLIKLSILYRTMTDAFYIDVVRHLREKILRREEELKK